MFSFTFFAFSELDKHQQHVCQLLDSHFMEIKPSELPIDIIAIITAYLGVIESVLEQSKDASS
jgi:hypothetical protein